MRYLVVGGAGFIGSHLVPALLEKKDTSLVRVLDNLKTGKRDNVPDGVEFIHDSAEWEDVVCQAMRGVDHVFHLAANADIFRAEVEPDLDWKQGTCLTHNVVMAAIRTGVKKITFTSSGGVYGNPRSPSPWNEMDTMEPIALYGAAKAASEMELCAWAHMNKGQAHCFRFANVVGPRQSHGVCFEFVKRFKEDPSRRELLINGDGEMRRHYVHASDIAKALLFVPWSKPYEIINVSTLGLITVNQIALMLVEELGRTDVKFAYKGGKVGWNGDQEETLMSCKKLTGMGWRPKFSGEEALRDTLKWLIQNMEVR